MVNDQPDEGSGRREMPTEEDVCRDEHAGGTAQRGSGKKVTRPSQRREMTGNAVALRGVSIALACRTFGQRDLLSLQRQAERRERTDRRSPDRADAGKEELGLRLVLSLPAQSPWASMEP